MTEEILTLAAALTGASDSERGALELLCAAAEREVLGRLRPDCDREEAREACLCAAAWLAAAGVLTGRGAGSAGDSFTIGEVSLSRSDPAQSRNTAACLRRQAWQLLRPYCQDGDFAFRGVAG